MTIIPNLCVSGGDRLRSPEDRRSHLRMRDGRGDPARDGQGVGSLRHDQDGERYLILGSV